MLQNFKGGDPKDSSHQKSLQTCTKFKKELEEHITEELKKLKSSQKLDRTQEINNSL